MKRFKRIAIILGIVLAVLVVAFFVLRAYTKSFSPEATANFTQGEFKIEINYCRPSKKGREIFGKLEPYGKVWRTGANEATEITLSKDVNFGGKKIKAGTYTLFTIPEEKEWTVILNSVLGQWGAFTHNEKKDVLRVKVPVENINTVSEMFTIDFKEINQGAEMRLTWDKTQVSVPIVME